jgi:hypothetical protein
MKGCLETSGPIPKIQGRLIFRQSAETMFQRLESARGENQIIGPVRHIPSRLIARVTGEKYSMRKLHHIHRLGRTWGLIQFPFIIKIFRDIEQEGGGFLPWVSVSAGFPVFGPCEIDLVFGTGDGDVK